jgi:hypothetical protein
MNPVPASMTHAAASASDAPEPMRRQGARRRSQAEPAGAVEPSSIGSLQAVDRDVASVNPVGRTGGLDQPPPHANGQSVAATRSARRARRAHACPLRPMSAHTGVV